MIEHAVEDAIKKLAHGFIEEASFDYVCPALFEGICDQNNWKFKLNEEYNGWEVDWWANIEMKDCIISVSGSMLYGTAHLSVYEWIM